MFIHRLCARFSLGERWTVTNRTSRGKLPPIRDEHRSISFRQQQTVRNETWDQISNSRPYDKTNRDRLRTKGRGCISNRGCDLSTCDEQIRNRPIFFCSSRPSISYLVNQSRVSFCGFPHLASVFVCGRCRSWTTSAQCATCLRQRHSDQPYRSSHCLQCSSLSKRRVRRRVVCEHDGRRLRISVSSLVSASLFSWSILRQTIQ